jgi:hypothetical protein
MLIENRRAKWITRDIGCPMIIRRLPLAVIIMLSSVPFPLTALFALKVLNLKRISNTPDISERQEAYV